MTSRRLIAVAFPVTLLSAPSAFAQGAAGAPAPAPAEVPAAPASAPPTGDAPQPAGAATSAPYYQAEPAPAPPPQAAPGIYVEQPPPPPLLPRTRHYHDGFYLRLSAGFGGMRVKSDLGDNGDAEVKGTGIAFDVMLGGTPAPGLVIGGGLLLQDAFDPHYEVHGPGFSASGTATAKDNNDLGFVLLGPMVDVFPNPSYGFHFGALLGVAQVGVQDDNDNSSGGLGGSIWAGYMWWTSSEWSIGGLGRVTGAWTGRTFGSGNAQFDVADSTLAYSLMFSAAFH